MGRRAIEIEVIFFDVLAMIAFAVGEAEQPLFQNRALAVPECEREAEPLAIVGESGQAVFAPMIGARASLIVGKVSPSVSAFAVILAHGPPLPFAEVGP